MGSIFLSGTITAERHQEIIMNFISLLEVANMTAGLSNIRL